MPVTEVGTLHVISHSVFTIVLGKKYHAAHLIDEAKSLARVHLAAGVKARFIGFLISIL